jgi:glycine/D-amino acid oxidase-like deaminating enzyme
MRLASRVVARTECRARCSFRREGAAQARQPCALRLFTPARYDALPGFAFPGDPGRYPGRDEVAAYLADYARHFALPVELANRVRSIRRTNGTYLVELDDRTHEADQVVVATGPFQVPRVPAIAEHLDPDVVQLHSSATPARAGICGDDSPWSSVSATYQCRGALQRQARRTARCCSAAATRTTVEAGVRLGLPDAGVSRRFAQ